MDLVTNASKALIVIFTLDKEQILITRLIRNLLRNIYNGFPVVRSIHIGEKKYKLHRIAANVINLDSSHEPWLDNIYEFFLDSREGVFLDVGANAGQTLAKVLSISPNQEYIGFEPQPSCAFFLEQFIRKNDLKSKKIIPIGLSDKNEICKLYLRYSGSNDSTASIAFDYRPNDFYEDLSYIPTMRGDDAVYVINIDKICAIKVDVEGAELEVFRGFENTINVKRPYIIFEVLNNYLIVTKTKMDSKFINTRNERALLISEFFKSKSYKIFNIIDGNFLEIQDIKPSESNDLSVTEYVAIPEELLEVFSRQFKGKILH